MEKKIVNINIQNQQCNLWFKQHKGTKRCQDTLIHLLAIKNISDSFISKS